MSGKVRLSTSKIYQNVKYFAFLKQKKQTILRIYLGHMETQKLILGGHPHLKPDLLTMQEDPLNS